ncbi:hypothetical protein DMH04_41310 [Kibdelosporangium aridum]|uniref:DUF3168 domain-containing protein n=1 Tax=Kibdelosporangium aridum TaxID=2030 RepID=A0A428YUQ9_KIBAR|nr:hypothetical protein [Kibdelosporangium aridum]RSM73453.1 hypothetical protein DMH04_41310 [Kibdelosporangium aridum]
MTQWPVVVMPDPTQLLIDLLSAHPSLPVTLSGKVSSELPEDFPKGLPRLQVRAVPGAGSRPVPIRVGQTAFDIQSYAATVDQAEQNARTVAAIVQSLIGKSTANGGVVDVEVTEPFPLPDVTTAERWNIPAVVTYRPL